MRNPARQTTFRFKQFEVSNCRSAMKVGTDGVLLGAWAIAKGDLLAWGRPVRILDVGCGTGVIALMMAQRFADARITGIEIDPAAAGEAAGNFAASPWGCRLDCVCAEFTEWVHTAAHERFDIVVSNPPFFSNGAPAPEAERHAARHEGSLSLESLLSAAKALLEPAGKIAMVLPSGHLQRLRYHAALNALHITRLSMVQTVAHKPPRRLLCELSAETPREASRTENLVIQTSGGIPTDRYRELVTPFYLH